MTTILGNDHFTILLPFSAYRCKDGLKLEKMGEKIVINQKGAIALRKFFPHLSHNDRELLFVGSVCKQEVERPECLQKLKISLVRSSLKMIS